MEGSFSLPPSLLSSGVGGGGGEADDETRREEEGEREREREREVRGLVAEVEVVVVEWLGSAVLFSSGLVGGSSQQVGGEAGWACFGALQGIGPSDSEKERDRVAATQPTTRSPVGIAVEGDSQPRHTRSRACARQPSAMTDPFRRPGTLTYPSKQCFYLLLWGFV